MSGDLDRLAAEAEEAAGRFGDRFVETVTLERDRALREELTYQAKPLMQALLEGIAGEGGELGSADAPELREAFALASLLGRRAAALGATPTAAVHLAPTLTGAVEGADALAEPLREVIVEGYVAEREEALERLGARRAAGAIPVIRLVPGCFVSLPAGDQGAEQLEEHSEELGRRLLDGDARALVVYARGLNKPTPERASQLLATHATCAMLGVTCVFAGVGDDWLAAAQERGTELSELTVVNGLAEGLDVALAECGYALRPHAPLSRMWRRLVGKG